MKRVDDMYLTKSPINHDRAQEAADAIIGCFKEGDTIATALAALTSVVAEIITRSSNGTEEDGVAVGLAVWHAIQASLCIQLQSDMED